MAQRSESVAFMEEYFRAGEADQWFLRNKGQIDQCREDDLIIEAIKAYGVKPKSILEIGCASGFRLHELKKIFNSEVSGVDLSQKAIEHGKSAFGLKNLHVASASEIPFENASFDLVIINFVLHWVDRSLLLKTVAEIDRVTCEGGLVLIGDFLPPSPVKNHYHHAPGKPVYTFKQDYPKIFTSSNLYSVISTQAFDHSTMRKQISEDNNQKCALTILQKGLQANYLDR